ncbi:MAG: S8 family serine peptidase, partial [Thermoanaerobaculia bacterium]
MRAENEGLVTKQTLHRGTTSAAITLLALLAGGLPLMAAAAPASLRLQVGTFDPSSSRPRLPEAAAFLPERPATLSGDAAYHIVQFIGPILPEWQESIRKTGAAISYYIPDFSLTVKMTQAEAAAVRQMPFVRWVGEFDPRWRVADQVLREVLSPPNGSVDWNVVAFPGEDVDSIMPELERRSGAQRLRSSDRLGRKTTLRAFGPNAIATLQLILANDAVAWVEPYVPHKISNNHSIWVGQSLDKTNGPTEAGAAAPSEYPTSATIWAHDILGQGQVIAYGDSGLRDDSCFARDGSGNVAHTSIAAPGALTVDTTRRKVIAYNIMPSAADGDHAGCSYHGSHVFGSIAGDNDANTSTTTLASHDAGDGMAPQAKVIMQDVGSGTATTCSLGGIPSDLRDFFKQAYDAGARLHSNSWGSSVNGQYTSDSQATDDYMYTNEDLLVLFAASNDGPAADTIGSPGTAKNCITVGAATNGAAASRAEDIADFSSQGPTDDLRIKPDIAAPGVDVVSENGGGSACGTQTMSGTSMATPTMAGLAALSRQYFTEGWYPSGTRTPADAFTPSTHLQKAALYASARAMTGIRTGGAALPGSPSNDQGWGRVLLDDGLFFSSGETGKMRVWDVRNCSGIQTGQISEYAVEVTTGKPLHIVVAWNDAPASLSAAKMLVNDINLEVIAPDGTVYHGNQWNAATQTAKESTANASGWDNTNNSEAVQLASPAAGTYRIRINGFNVPGYNDQYKQGYGLAAAGNVTTTCLLAAPTGVSASVTGANQVTISWTAVSGATRYAVYRAPEGAADCSSCMQQIGSTTGTSYADNTVNGGFTYYYHVKTVSPCDGAASSCVSATATGNCTNDPTFSGLVSATNAAASTCTVNLSWSAGTSNCPLATTVKYNIYRSTTPGFTASAATRIATCVSGTAYADSGLLTSGTTYYYVVRAEDSTTGNGGPCGGGNEDGNNVIRSATPAGTGSTVGTWTDGGGDTTAQLSRSGSWSIVSDAGYAQTGTYAYKSTPGTTNYADNTCSAITTPTLTAGAANPVVTFWERHSLELDWDGVTVEQSVNGGAWTVVTGIYGGGAFGNAGNACGYPVDGPAYEGDSGGGAFTAYTSRTFTITAAAGATVAVRWNLSSDTAANQLGFLLDTISITNISVPNACAACTTPGTPSGLTATTPAANQIALSWTAGAPAGATWEVYRSDGACPGGTFTLLGNGVTTTNYTDTTVSGGLAYSYKVRAIDSTGSCGSGDSNCASATATGAPNQYSSGKTAGARPEDTSGTTNVRWLYVAAAASLNPPTLNSAVYGVSNDRILHSMNLTVSGGDWPLTPPKAWKPLPMNAPAQGRAPVWNVGSYPIGGASRVTVVASQDGRVYCANADTGALIWTSAVLGEMLQGWPSGIFRQYGSSLTKDLIIVGTRNSSSA